MTPPEPFRYRRHFPWLHLFRAFGIAVSLRQLLLSGLALVVLMLGLRLGDTVSPVEPAQSPFRVESLLTTMPDTWQKNLAMPHTERSDAARPWRDVLAAASDMLNPASSSTRRISATFRFVLSIAVWSLFGLAIGRLAAIQMARDEVGSLRRATQLGVSRWSRAVVSPLIPLALATVVMFCVSCLVLPSHLPLIGHVWLYVAAPALLAGGCAVVVLLLTAALGWPLMIAAIAADDCDGFGGLSRSYSLCTGRPAHAFGFAVVALAFESFVLTIATLFLDNAIVMVQYGAALATSDPTQIATVSRACGLVAECLLGTFEVSLFWTSAMIVYLLLREAVDQMPLDRLAPDDSERPPRNPLPVVGILATDAAPAEAPLTT